MCASVRNTLSKTNFEDKNNKTNSSNTRCAFLLSPCVRVYINRCPSTVAVIRCRLGPSQFPEQNVSPLFNWAYLYIHFFFFFSNFFSLAFRSVEHRAKDPIGHVVSVEVHIRNRVRATGHLYRLRTNNYSSAIFTSTVFAGLDARPRSAVTSFYV